MKTDGSRRLLIMLMCLVVFAAVMYSAFAGGKQYQGKQHAAQYILQNHIEQTGAKSAVAAIYLNYRLFDTLFECLVLVLSAVAVIYFSWSGEDE